MPKQSEYEPFEALLRACSNGDLALVKQLIKSGVDQNTPVGAPRGWSPLMMAAYHGHRLIVYWLVRQGARLDTVEVDGWLTAIDLAAMTKQHQIVKYLRRKKAPTGAEVPNPYRKGKLGGWGSDEK